MEQLLSNEARKWSVRLLLVAVFIVAALLTIEIVGEAIASDGGSGAKTSRIVTSPVTLSEPVPVETPRP